MLREAACGKWRHRRARLETLSFGKPLKLQLPTNQAVKDGWASANSSGQCDFRQATCLQLLSTTHAIGRSASTFVVQACVARLRKHSGCRGCCSRRRCWIVFSSKDRRGSRATRSQLYSLPPRLVCWQVPHAERMLRPARRHLRTQLTVSSKASCN